MNHHIVLICNFNYKEHQLNNNYNENLNINENLDITFFSQKNSKFDKNMLLPNTFFYIFVRNKTKQQRKDNKIRYIGKTTSINLIEERNHNIQGRNKYLLKICLKNEFNTIIEPSNIGVKHYIHVNGITNFLNLEKISDPCSGIILYKEKNFQEESKYDSDEDDNDYILDLDHGWGDSDDEMEDLSEDFSNIMSNNSKFVIMIKPTQSRKTKATIDVIQRKINNNNHKIIQLVDNSLLQNQQFSKRMKTKMINQEIITLSGRKKSVDCKEFQEIIKSLFLSDDIFNENNINTLLACKNYKQLNNIYTLIRLIEYLISMNKIDKNTKISINIDEIDNHISLLDKELKLNEDIKEKFNLQDEKINFWQLSQRSEIIDEVLTITATPYKQFEYFQENNIKLKIFQLNQTFDENLYYGFKDSKLHLFKQKNKRNLCGLVEHCLKKINTENSYLFVPAKTAKKSHNKVKDILIKKYNVLIINSDGKILYTKDGSEINLNKELNNDEELSTNLPEIIQKYKLNNLAITGNISIGRGVTFVSKQFIFTDAIFSDIHLSNDFKCYQLIGRITGNFHYCFPNGFTPINVYCSKKFAQKMKAIEKISMKYAIKYKNDEEDHLDNYDDLKNKNLRNEERQNFEIIHDGYITGDNYNDIFLKYKKLMKDNNVGGVRNTKKKYENGFILQSFENQKKGDNKVYSKEEFDDMLETKGYQTFLTKNTNGFRKRIFWLYKNKNDKNTLIAYCKCIKENEIEEEEL